MKQKPSSRTRRRSNKSVLRLPDLEHAKAAICARALKSLHLLELRPRGHHDWPVMLPSEKLVR